MRQYRYVEIIPGTEPGKVSIVTDLLHNPLGPLAKKAMKMDGAVTDNIDPAEAPRIAKAIDTWMATQNAHRPKGKRKG